MTYEKYLRVCYVNDEVPLMEKEYAELKECNYD